MNVMRLSMHPDGLAPRIANYRQWRSRLLARLRHQVEVTGDPLLTALASEVGNYAVPETSTHAEHFSRGDVSGIVVPLHLVTDAGIVSLLSTTTVFGTAADVAVSEIAFENFYPMNADSAALLRQRAAG